MKTAVLVLVLFAKLAHAAAPFAVTAPDVSLKVKGGADYTHFTNQYQRDVAEQTLANVYLPQVVAYMRSMGKYCSGYMSNAWSQLPVIYQRLDVVNQYRGRVLNGGTWQVTNGGRHYQIEYYQMQHAQSCSVGSGKYDCAAKITPELLTLLNMHIDNGACVKDPVDDLPAVTSSLVGLVNGKTIFPILDAASEAALKQAEDAHAASMCGMPPSLIGIKAAQDIYIGLSRSVEEAHFRTPQPFKGGCDPIWYPEECCRWKYLEHQEYTAWAHAQRMGRWGESDCFGERHAHVHVCANLYGPYTIRLPSCVFGDYPDDAPPMTCQDYLRLAM